MANEREGNFILNNYDKDTGLPFNSRIISQFPDGTPITDTDVDNKVLLKNSSRNGGGYSVRSYDVGQSKTLVVDNVEAIRNLSKSNALMFRFGIYTSIDLLGYYEKGDLRSIVNYKVSFNESRVDDGAEVIDSVYGMKFVHDFGDTVDVTNFGARGDGVQNDGAIIQRILDNTKYKDVFIPHKPQRYLITESLKPKTSNLTIHSNYAAVGYADGVDGIVFDIDSTEAEQKRKVTIRKIRFSNSASAQTCINAKSAHHLTIDDCRAQGCKLFLKTIDTYFARIMGNFLFATHQAFDMRQASNAFLIQNNSIYGEGIASYWANNTTGGSITANCFELGSGRLEFGFGNSGINISGNYFEGYNQADYYIKLNGGSNYKECNGFSITGNIFYIGATAAIALMGCRGVSIDGNQFSTKHAVRVESYDGLRNDNIAWGANHWVSTESGASKFLYAGPKKDAILSLDWETPQRIVPTSNIELENKDNDILTYNSAGKYVFKKENRVYEYGFSTTLLAKTTVIDQIEVLPFNLLNKPPIVKVYVFNSQSNLYNEYTLIVMASNRSSMYIKTNSNTDIAGISLTITAEGTGLRFVDTVGGRYLNIVVST